MRDEPEVQRRLAKLLSTLRHYHGELELAELNGFDFVAQSARREIRNHQDVIRRICEAAGLPVPPEVWR